MVLDAVGNFFGGRENRVDRVGRTLVCWKSWRGALALDRMGYYSWSFYRPQVDVVELLLQLQTEMLLDDLL